MLTKFLKRIAEEVAGEAAGEIVDLLANKKNVNEFIIAKKLKLTINQTRNLLYKLSHLGILSSVRKKDKRKGWYIYFWTLNVLKSLEILEERVGQDLEKYEGELTKKEAQIFYKCNLCSVEVGEESAILTDFTCRECGEVYELSDTKPHIEEITKYIFRLKKELALIVEERKKEQEKEDKKLTRIINKREKEKKEARAERARIRAKERVKEKKLAEKGKKGKKPAKKKSIKKKPVKKKPIKKKPVKKKPIKKKKK